MSRARRHPSFQSFHIREIVSRRWRSDCRQRCACALNTSPRFVGRLTEYNTLAGNTWGALFLVFARNHPPGASRGDTGVAALKNIASVLGIAWAQGFPFASICAGAYAGWHYKIWPQIFWWAAAWALIWAASFFFWDLRPRREAVSLMGERQGIKRPMLVISSAKALSSGVACLGSAALVRMVLRAL